MYRLLFRIHHYYFLEISPLRRQSMNAIKSISNALGRSLGAPRLPSLHEFQTPWEVSLQTKFRPQESSRLLQPLDVPSNLPWRILSTRRRKSQAHNVQHAVIESIVELSPAARIGVVVPALIAAVRIQIPAKLDDELKR